jgi:transcriptional regulator with XRE-family HTH domain
MTDRFNSELGRKIRAAREIRKVTQEQLGSAVKLSRTSITNIELGRQRLLVDQLAGIASMLETPMEELIPSADFLRPEPVTAEAAVGSEMPTVMRFIQAVRAEPRR